MTHRGLHELRQRRGIAFLVVVLVLGLATIAAGTGVTVYKISQGQRPSLQIQTEVANGTAKLQVDPQVGASLQSKDLGAGGYAQGVFGGGSTSNTYFVLDKNATPPPGALPVSGVTVNPSLPSNEATISLSQQLQFSASITNPTIPFTADGSYNFSTSVAAPSSSTTLDSFASWQANPHGLSLTSFDSTYTYGDASTFSLSGSGMASLGTYALNAGDQLDWNMNGGEPLLAAELSTVPEPTSIVLLTGGTLSGLSWYVLRRLWKRTVSVVPG
jgi:hypothetical protein